MDVFYGIHWWIIAKQIKSRLQIHILYFLHLVRQTAFFQLLQLIAKSKLTSLSGAAQKNYFNILDKIVRKGKAARLLLYLLMMAMNRLL